MQKITVDLENCYGIGRLTCEFDFSKSHVHAVYAPNGFMKTSFAQTFDDISHDKESSDRVFPSRVTRRKVRDESGSELQAANVLMVPPYREDYQPQEVSTLLVEASLKAQYDKAVAEIADLLT